MSRIWRKMITGVAFLVYISTGMIIPPALAVEDVNLVVTSAQLLPVTVQNKNKKVSAGEDFIRVNRGQFIKIEAVVSNLSKASSAPFNIGIYLSNYRDGRDKVHEFDVIKGVSLSESEQIPVSGQYLIPYSIEAGRSYWVVVEADYDRNVNKKDEKNRRMIRSIFVPCDEFAIDYPDYLCIQPGEND